MSMECEGVSAFCKYKAAREVWFGKNWIIYTKKCFKTYENKKFFV